MTIEELERKVGETITFAGLFTYRIDAVRECDGDAGGECYVRGCVGIAELTSIDGPQLLQAHVDAAGIYY